MDSSYIIIDNIIYEILVLNYNHNTNHIILIILIIHYVIF